MNPYIDYLIHSGELGVFLLVAWHVIRRINRDETLKQDFPPHRHVNGKIIYPHEYEPGVVEQSNGAVAH